MTHNAEQRHGCLIAPLEALRSLLRRGAPASEESGLPYRVRDGFLSPAELLFCHALRSAVGAQAVVYAKVNLSDLLYVIRPNENASYRNRIAQKHVDFLLCSPESMRPLVAIELDDKTHEGKQRQERDQLVNDACAAAGLPVVRIRAQSDYSAVELAGLLSKYLQQGTQAETAPLQMAGSTPSEGTTPPSCPRCGIPLVLKTASKGAHAGSQFYGCPNFPKCRYTQPV